MANNIISGPNSVIALPYSQGINLDDLPNVNVNTVHVIYETDGQYRSWVPGRNINQFNILRTGIGYLVIAKQGIDLSLYFSPPLPSGFTSVFVIGDGEGNVIGDGEGNVIGNAN